MRKYRIGILGATGAVGREMLKILDEYNVPIEELRLLASKRSAGKVLEMHQKSYVIEEATKESFKNLDFVLGAVSNQLAKEFASDIVQAGAVFIDNSSAFRMDDAVPLVIPEINPEDIRKHKGIIANPNCSTIIAFMAIHAIHKLSPIKSIVASTYQATSGAGAAGPKELENQMKAMVQKEQLVHEVFPFQIAENLIPQIGSFLDNGYTTEEMKMQNEGRKILHADDLNVTCTCVRVPVVRSHSISLTFVTEHHLELNQVREALEKEAGVKLYDSTQEQKYPMPILTSDQDLVYVGRIRPCLIHENGMSLWCCGDQIRKGAATNAIQIMMKLIGLEY
ncbi:MAG: aspartate-semialdehyde dehydrogenase [Anaeroplasmataceae bacterium]|nr:aspartate-semialdehyde dehydrogenase [Anaeroplasmataceae bacterium]